MQPYSEVLGKAVDVKYEMSQDRLVSLTPTELISLTSQLDIVTDFIRNYPVSTNIVTKLREKYPQWVLPGITSVRIIHKSKTVFLDITETKHFDDAIDRWTEEKVTRIDIGYLFEDMDSEFFKTDITAQENAELFLANPYICADLFTAEGCAHLIQNADHPIKPTKQLEKHRTLLASGLLSDKLLYKNRTGEVRFSEAVKSIASALGVSEHKGALIVYGQEGTSICLCKGMRHSPLFSQQFIEKRIIDDTSIQAAEVGDYIVYDEWLSTFKTVSISAEKISEVNWKDLGANTEA